MSFDPFLRTVANMMQRFGGDGTLHSTVGTSVYDPETSSMSVEVKEYPIRGMMFDYVPKMDGAGTNKNNLVRIGDKQLIIKTNSDNPAPKAGTDKITFGGVTYAVITVKTSNPSGATPIYYEAFLRQ